MRFYIPPMDAVLVEFDNGGRVKFDREDWSVPTVQGTRAILYAAHNEVAALQELIAMLEEPASSRP